MSEKEQNKAEKMTPMMEQYFAIKKQTEGYLLFYRMGDFYEMFFDDAVKAAAALDIALTKRGKNNGKDIPMCGVPVHSHEMYLSRLIRKGFKVAICEQTEDPAEARRLRGSTALVNRDVIRLITPGTLTEDNILEARACNYLVSLTETNEGMGMAWVDVSTGDFAVQTLPARKAVNLAAGLSRLDPKEIIVSEKILQTPEFFEVFNDWKAALTPLPPSRFNPENGQKRLEAFFKVGTLDSFGAFNKSELAAAGALVDYIELTQKGQMPRLNPLRRFSAGRLMEIDAATRRNLELFRSLSGEKSPSLFSAIDRTVTGAGARLLSRYLSAPLTDAELEVRVQERSLYFSLTDGVPILGALSLQAYHDMFPDNAYYFREGGKEEMNADARDWFVYLEETYGAEANEYGYIQVTDANYNDIREGMSILAENLRDNLPNWYNTLSILTYKEYHLNAIEL